MTNIRRTTKAGTFNAAVEAFILAFGGKKIRERPGNPGLEKIGPEFAIQTIAGKMTVTPEGDWIACRFQDVDAAKAVLPYWPKDKSAQLNGFSGKWNFVHARDGQFDAEENLSAFKTELAFLLPGRRGCPRRPGTAAFAARVICQPVEERETGPWSCGWIFESPSEAAAMETLKPGCRAPSSTSLSGRRRWTWRARSGRPSARQTAGATPLR
jgi:hypothetical protein